MVDLPTVVAIGLLVLGVVGSVVPGLPGALLSLSGVFLYAWSTGFAEPSLPVLVAFVVVGLLALAADYFGGPIAAGMGGASRRTVAVAALVGLALFFLTGPVGAILGLTATVFAVELRRSGDARAGGRAALYAAIGVFGSTVVQVLLTGAMLVGFLLVVAW